MKKLFILLLLSITILANGQEAKPTKQETIDYITNYILKADSMYLSYVSGKTEFYNETEIFSILEFSINGLILKAKTSHKQHYRNWARDIDRYQLESITDVEIDLAKVDFLGWGNYKNSDGSTSNCSYILFHLKGDGPTTFKARVLVVGQVDSESQIFRAFNHLRKLCGAPEPIKI